MDLLLCQVNRLIDDKDRLVSEKDSILVSQHQMWREMAQIIKEKDARIGELLDQVHKLERHADDTLKEHARQLEQLRSAHQEEVERLEGWAAEVQDRNSAEIQALRERNTELAKTLDDVLLPGGAEARKKAAEGEGEGLDRGETKGSEHNVSSPDANHERTAVVVDEREPAPPVKTVYDLQNTAKAFEFPPDVASSEPSPS